VYDDKEGTMEPARVTRLAYPYTVAYFFGWRVKDTTTGRTSERAVGESHAWRLADYLNGRQWR